LEAALLPIVLDPASSKIGLCGVGEGLVRRAALLAEAGVEPIAVPAHGPVPDGLAILFIAGLPAGSAASLARRARAQNILVNVEDVPALCDFHVPAIIRRGDLTLTISTAGRSPGLARLIREWIERRLGLEWSGRLYEAAQLRDAWRKQGHPAAEVARRTRAFVGERDWLA
jgi:precorrin-2 dehydrogenase/sirohydrochlorin ferrochelatase